MALGAIRYRHTDDHHMVVRFEKKGRTGPLLDRLISHAAS